MASETKETQKETSKVTQAAGGHFPILPGETRVQYEQGLKATFDELGASTELQIYLAEKIFQCIWWTRRYETQKHSLIMEGLVNELCTVVTPAEEKHALRVLIFDQGLNNPSVQTALKKSSHTQASILQMVISKCNDELLKLDQHIALRMKTLMQLQQSYEALVNRSIMQERLKLQNQLLKRDLEAIEVAEVKLMPQNDKPKAKSRK